MINADTKELVGVLVGVCTALGEAYLIPAQDIIDNIKATRGVKVARLPTMSEMLEEPSYQPPATKNKQIESMTKLSEDKFDKFLSLRLP